LTPKNGLKNTACNTVLLINSPQTWLSVVELKPAFV